MTENYVIKCSGARVKATQKILRSLQNHGSCHLRLSLFKECPPNAQRIACQD